MKKIAIFASGRGSNAENIIKYFKGSTKIKVQLIASNNSDSVVLNKAKKYAVKTLIFDKQELN